MEQFKEMTSRLSLKSSEFMHSYYFLAFQIIYTVIAWYLATSFVRAPYRIIGEYILVIGFCISMLCILIFSSDGALIGTPVLFAMFGFAVLPYFDTLPVSITVMGVVLILSLLLMFLKKMFVTKDINFKFGSIGISFSLVVFFLFVSELVNQFTRPTAYDAYGWVSISIAAIILLLYFFFVSTSEKGYMNHLNKVFYSMNLIVLIELFMVVISVNFSGRNYIYDLGWGTKNVISLALEICLPFVALIFSNNKRRIDALIILGLDYFFIFASHSRGGSVTAVGLAFVLAYILASGLGSRKTRGKKRFWSNYLIFIAGVVAVCYSFYLFSPTVHENINYLLQNTTNLTDRDKIWKECIVYVKQNWLFGGSMTGLFEMYQDFGYNDNIGIWLCHNTVFTLITAGGVLCVLAYIYNVFETVYSSFKIKSMMKYAVICFLLIGFVHGMVDNTFFNPLYMIPFIMIFSKPDLKNAYLKNSNSIN